MLKVDIRVPIFSSKSLGIHVPRDYNGMIEVSCSYKTKKDLLLYPNPWIVSATLIRSYPTQRVHRNVIVNVVPISVLNENSQV
jgi:hypothetical protein